MVTVVAIGRHNAESCAFFNETSKKRVMEWAAKNPELEAKHGVKMVGAWTVPPEHLTIQVFEAPSQEAMQAYASEPEVIGMMSWSTLEYKMAMTLAESMQAMRQ